MAYGTKYKVTYPDRFFDEVEILLQKNGYSDAVIQVKTQGNPLSIYLDSSTDILHEPINGSRVIVRLASATTFDFSQFYTSDSREWKVIININSVLYWTGFGLPDLFGGPYATLPYTGQIAAADQLGYLRSLAWDKTGPYTDLNILEFCLGATDLDLDLYEAVNIYEENHAQTAADSPLNQTYINAEAFAGKSYYDALYATLFKYGAIIKQSKGAWQITRVKESRTSYPRRLWTYAAGTFTYDSTATHNPITTTTSATAFPLIRIAAGGNKSIDFPWKQYSLLQTLGKLTGFVDNPEFKNWVNNTVPEDWVNIGGLSVVRNLDRAQMIRVAIADRDKYLTQEWALEKTSTQKIKINLKYIVGSVNSGALSVSFALIIENAGFEYYFNFNTGQWYPGPKYFTKSYSDPAVEEIEIITNTLSVGTILAGTLKIRFYAPVNVVELTGTFMLDECKMSILKYNHVALTTEEYDEEITTDVEINPNNIHDAGQFKLLTSGIEQVPNSGLVFIGGVWLDAVYVNAAIKWIDSDGTEGTLVELLIDSFASEYLHPRQRLSVIIYAPYDSLQVTDTIEEINNDLDKFIIRRAQYDSRYGRWKVEIVELYEEAFLITESDDYIITEDGDRLKLW